jgi:MGT family glycosyltransferase
VARFLIATMPVPGHVAPMATVARTLVARGHEVVWYTGRFFQSRIEATGARFVAITSTIDYGDSDYSRHYPERGKFSGLAQVKFDFKHLFADAVPGYLDDLDAILDDFPADVLLGDPGVVAASILGERRGLPWAILNISVLGIPSRDVAPLGLGLLPDRSPLGRPRNRALYWVADNVVFRDVNQHFAAIARRAGFAPFPFRPTVSPYLYLQPTVPAFEFPRSDLPPSVHFIGPILPDSPALFTPPAWWQDMLESRRPVVLVTQGTIATDPRELLLPTLRALADMDVLVVGTADPSSLGHVELPSNARLAAYLPFGELMPHVAAMVTNGGYGGVTIALAHGVPVVTAGSTEDKPEVGNRVLTSGVGIRLKSAQPTPSEIGTAVRAVLAEPGYRARAQAMQSEFAGHDAPREGAELLEVLARTKQPVVQASAYAMSPTTSRVSATAP